MAEEETNIIDDLAELLAGLQVPRSLVGNPSFILGAALESYDRLLHRDRGFGWRTAGDFVDMLRRELVERGLDGE